jgi:hypothetical protein
MNRRPAAAAMQRKRLAYLRAKKDDASCNVETRDGHPHTLNDAQVEGQVKLGRRFMATYRNTFRALANRKGSRRDPTSGAGASHDSAHST